MEKSFLQKNRPTITTMLKGLTTEELLKEIEIVLNQGTDAFGFQIEETNPECRTVEDFEKIFNAMQGKPVYITNYTRRNALPFTDEELTEQLFVAAQCGDNPKLVDIRCDLFDRQPDEYTYDEEAVKRQKEVIEKFHEMGVEVLMSTHIFHYFSGEDVLKLALAQQERGVDIVKIVTIADTQEELLENLRTTIVLKEKLSVPSLFLCNGSHCIKHRILGPALGTDLFLTVENSQEGGTQQTIKRAKEILTLAGYTDLP